MRHATNIATVAVVIRRVLGALWPLVGLITLVIVLAYNSCSQKLQHFQYFAVLIHCAVMNVRPKCTV